MTDILLTIIIMIALALLWVMLYDTNRFVIRNHQVKDPRIRHGCRAVLLTDLHNKCYGKENERLLAAIHDQKPDFILIAGDLLTANPNAPLQPALQLLENLTKVYPVYYGNGNHEQRLREASKYYGKMAKQYKKALKRIGIAPLRNGHVNLPEFGITVYGLEIDMEYYKRFRKKEMSSEYLPHLLGQASPDAYTVLLAHNPDYFPQYASWGADLTLSGHVHGGVARVPFWGKGVLAPSWHFFPKYDGGIFRERESVMVLSRGLGSHTIPVRVFNPGELWVIDFQPEE